MRKNDNNIHLKLDHRIIASIITPESRVLDLGCGEGQLLEYLVKTRGIEGYGIEINESAIYKCVEKGLSVSHEDIDSGLKDYPDHFFDYVIFNQTMQQVHKPKKAIHRALRIGKQIIVGFPNFCHIFARYQLTIRGNVPITRSLPYTWYDTPNMHFLSIKDFQSFCRQEKIRIKKITCLTQKRTVKILPNLFAYNAIFLIEKS
ncbi:MAG: methionine biosynthesis protein MetW [Spirochaetes bacterium]|nr:methionine biosynthesis protein MetW [Spirochaetota bacterium]